MLTRIPKMYSQIPMYSRHPMDDQVPMTPKTDTEMKPCPTTPVPPGSTGGPDFELQPGPPVQESIKYTQGWLMTQIGKYMKFEFLIGTNFLIDREGILTEVGISYIVIKEAGTNDILMCDIYSIKFARVYDNQDKAQCIMK